MHAKGFVHRSFVSTINSQLKHRSYLCQQIISTKAQISTFASNKLKRLQTLSIWSYSVSGPLAPCPFKGHRLSYNSDSGRDQTLIQISVIYLNPDLKLNTHPFSKFMQWWWSAYQHQLISVTVEKGQDHHNELYKKTKINSFCWQALSSLYQVTALNHQR